MSPRLYEEIRRKNTLQRLTDLTIFFLLLSLLAYRLRFLDNHGLPWFLAFLCESWFTFLWVIIMNTKWSPVVHKTYPQHLQKKMDELPPMDMFVTTADPVLEPPIITVNTVLSLLAIDYPANKLACYVSDDGASPITFYSLTEALKFAKIWIPYCKKHNVQVRAPFRYFTSENQPQSNIASSEFLQEWTHMKNEYKLLVQNIEAVERNPSSCTYEFFSKVEKSNHPTIIKVLWENKEGLADGVPHLVYVSREKHPKYPHHFKAGALNVLGRVSGVMTNAPVMLNVDCDMFVNNPQIALHAMCFLVDNENKERDIAYVQCPQVFYGGLKDDPFGNQMIVLQEYLGRGMGGIQGPFYSGTGCFHRRKVIYGLSPNETTETKVFSSSNVKSVEELKNTFGHSTKLVESAVKALSGINESSSSLSDITSSIEEAIQVAGATYEFNTQWGNKVGCMYGSTTEDVQTGLRIQSKGWRSVYSTPKTPGFLGCAPSSLTVIMVQQARWTTGLLEILFTNNNPMLVTIFGNLRFRQFLAYLYCNTWAMRSLPELCYNALPAYCLLSNTSFLPSITDPAILIPTSLLVIYNTYTLSEFLRTGLSVRAWWNTQRMSRIVTTSAWLFGLANVALKLLGLSETVFHVTPKDRDEHGEGAHGAANASRFTFDESPVFVPGTALVMLHVIGLVVGISRWVRNGDLTAWIGEVVCCVWVVASFMPFVKGLVRKGKYGVPWSVVGKAGVLVGLLVNYSYIS
ncbi:hypothetical protein Scep_028810 [Stephania cephalantha]|uniref:Cellulose synthase-like protein H1 n=1 Tax=Stephania cephalantha TaxID=152367 RepID=A0AAP0HIG7_9MAGN